MSTETTPKRKAPQAKVYIFNNKEFLNIPSLLDHLISLHILTIKPRVILCRYCGANLLPINEAAHYFKDHRDKLNIPNQ